MDIQRISDDSFFRTLCFGKIAPSLELTPVDQLSTLGKKNGEQVSLQPSNEYRVALNHKYVESESSPIKMRSVQNNPGNSINDAVELRIQVKGMRPPVWRRVIVHPDTELKELHGLMGVLLGWKDGRSHHFEYRGSALHPEGIEDETRRISKFAVGADLVYYIDETGGQEFSVKVVRKDRERTGQLPFLVGGMRTIDSVEKDPYDIPIEKIEEGLRSFHRFDDHVPDRDGNLVEPWRAATLTRSDDLPEDFAKILPGIASTMAKKRSVRPLEPVSKKVAPNTPVDLRIALKDMPVPVWRLVSVNSQITFHDLHRVIQASFGWDDSHLYEFVAGDSHIQSFDEDDVGDFPMGIEVIDAKRIRIRDIMTGKGWSIQYVYDFGDGWTHSVKAVKVRSGEPRLDRAELLDGSGACPPEDCGGPYGYQELIDVLNDPKNREHEDMAEWFGAERLDPNEFDIEAAKIRIGSLKWIS